jgi:ribose 5-phosphate isomerase A
MTEKKIAAEKSVEFIENGMVVGLGTGSTVVFMINALNDKIKNGLNIRAISTSQTTSDLAISKGIEIVNIDEVGSIDITIDGADEVDPNLNGIKGGGGALLFEKIVARASKKNIWIVDSSKLVNQLGASPLPVEVLPYGKQKTINILKKLNFNPKFRMKNNELYYTDSGNVIIDLNLGTIENSIILEEKLNSIPGVIENGLFNDIADLVIVGRENSVEVIKRKI